MVNEVKKIISPSAQKVQDAIRALGFAFQVVEYLESTKNPAEAAARVGCQVGQIVKSLVFRREKTGKAVLILTSGANRVDEPSFSLLLGETILRADADFVRKNTGYAIGGIPPIGHDFPLETYIDEDLLQHGNIWAAAGTPNAVFELTPSSLLKMTNGRIITVKP